MSQLTCTKPDKQIEEWVCDIPVIEVDVFDDPFFNLTYDDANLIIFAVLTLWLAAVCFRQVFKVLDM